MVFDAFAGLLSMALKNGLTYIQMSEFKIWISFSVNISNAKIMVGSRPLLSEQASLGSIFHPLDIGNFQIFPGSYLMPDMIDYTSPSVINFLRPSQAQKAR
jgi:hypothetical protein